MDAKKKRRRRRVDDLDDKRKEVRKEEENRGRERRERRERERRGKANRERQGEKKGQHGHYPSVATSSYMRPRVETTRHREENEEEGKDWESLVVEDLCWAYTM
ncbi:hypothetical protein H6P81_018803 [Aristolochia fimbriata]|uniref:Uncharacterized protein n=1 Tax=Aristolochia fimbriata TaxID=158543 RepID=A0AAV7E389_ARIFI|nr:hypothetical protein H6P81_018803 [Aristolochia fimbriata]